MISQKLARNPRVNINECPTGGPEKGEGGGCFALCLSSQNLTFHFFPKSATFSKNAIAARVSKRRAQ